MNKERNKVSHYTNKTLACAVAMFVLLCVSNSADFQPQRIFILFFQ